MRNKIPLIIDCDPGIDDAFALVYTKMTDAFDVRAVFSVAGNVPIEMTTLNAQFILSNLEIDTLLFEGAHSPLVGEPIIAKYAHGSNGLGGFEFLESDLYPVKKDNPTDAYYKLLSESDGPITIAALGPLTNLAKLFLAYPDAKNYIKEIYVMGGGVKGGNYTPTAEFNIAADALAAQIVINSQVKLYFVPLDTTMAITFRRDFMLCLKDSKNKLANLLYEIVNAKEKLDVLSTEPKLYLHDMITMLSIIHPEWFTLIKTHVAVELHGTLTKGMTVFDLREYRAQKPNAFYVAQPQESVILKHINEVLL